MFNNCGKHKQVRSGNTYSSWWKNHQHETNEHFLIDWIVVTRWHVTPSNFVPLNWLRNCYKTFLFSALQYMDILWLDGLVWACTVCWKVFDVCVTVHHQYNDVNNQQDATILSFINFFKSALHVSGETCRADLKRLIKERVVASCWFLTSLYCKVYLALFAKLRKATISFATCLSLSVRPHRKTRAPTGQIFMKFDIWVF